MLMSGLKYRFSPDFHHYSLYSSVLRWIKLDDKMRDLGCFASSINNFLRWMCGKIGLLALLLFFSTPIAAEIPNCLSDVCIATGHQEISQNPSFVYVRQHPEECPNFIEYEMSLGNRDKIIAQVGGETQQVFSVERHLYLDKSIYDFSFSAWADILEEKYGNSSRFSGPPANPISPWWNFSRESAGSSAYGDTGLQVVVYLSDEVVVSERGKFPGQVLVVSKLGNRELSHLDRPPRQCVLDSVVPD